MFTFEKSLNQIEFEDTSYCEAYQTESILPYVIKQNGEIVGYLFAENHGNELNVQFIEILDSLKEQGLGTEIVLSLFDSFNVQYLTGSIMLDDGGRAYYFWQSLGSEMSIELDDSELHSFQDDIYFTLERQ